MLEQILSKLQTFQNLYCKNLIIYLIISILINDLIHIKLLSLTYILEPILKIICLHAIDYVRDNISRCNQRRDSQNNRQSN